MTRLVVVVERVVAGRDAAAHPLDADRVEPRERDGEAVPELLLELREHALDGQHQDAPPPAAGAQLADEDARLQGLAQPHRVGDQDALPRLSQRLPGRLELIGRRIHRRPVGDVDALVVRDRLPELALQVESAAREAGRLVWHKPGVGGIQDLDVRLQGGEEDRLALPHQLRDAVAHELISAVRGAVDAADHPLGVSDHDTGAGGQHGACTGNVHVRHDPPEPRRRDAAVSPSTSPSSHSPANCTQSVQIALMSAATLNPFRRCKGGGDIRGSTFRCRRERDPAV